MKLKFTSMSKTLTNLLAVQMVTLCITTSLLTSNIKLKQRIDALERKSTTSVDFRNVNLLATRMLVEPQDECVSSDEQNQNISSEETEVVNVEPINSEIVEDKVVIEDNTINEYASEYILPFSQDEIYTIAKVCLAEAENQSEYGKRLVISTILNRLDSGIYGSTVYDVIYAPYQFEVTMNGRLDRVEPDEYMIDLVRQEVLNRSNYDVFYFRTNYYSEYGSPMFVDGDHYFSARY